MQLFLKKGCFRLFWLCITLDRFLIRNIEVTFYFYIISKLINSSSSNLTFSDCAIGACSVYVLKGEKNQKHSCGHALCLCLKLNCTNTTAPWCKFYQIIILIEFNLRSILKRTVVQWVRACTKTTVQTSTSKILKIQFSSSSNFLKQKMVVFQVTFNFQRCHSMHQLTTRQGNSNQIIYKRAWKFETQFNRFILSFCRIASSSNKQAMISSKQLHLATHSYTLKYHPNFILQYAVAITPRGVLLC